MSPYPPAVIEKTRASLPKSFDESRLQQVYGILLHQVKDIKDLMKRAATQSDLVTFAKKTLKIRGKAREVVTLFEDAHYDDLQKMGYEFA